MKLLASIVALALVLVASNSARAEEVDCSEKGVRNIVKQWTPTAVIVSDSAYWGIREAYKALSQCLTRAPLEQVSSQVLPALHSVDSVYRTIEAMKADRAQNEPPVVKLEAEQNAPRRCMNMRDGTEVCER